MMKALLKIILSTVLTLWVITTITFILMYSVPGSPFASVELDGSQTANYQEEMEKRYNLDKPKHIQYITYMKNLVKGDLGVSIVKSGMSANDIVASTFPPSAKLGLVSLIVSLIVGIYLGLIAAINQGKWQDKLAMVISTLGITTPSFVIATLLIYFFGVYLRVLPVMGLASPKHFILPVFSLSIVTIATIARITRSSVLDVIRQDYIRTAKAKGLTKNIIIYKHVLKNSVIPVITLLGPLLAGVLTGSFVVENIFAIPGMGNELVLAIGNRDYPIILAMTIVFSVILVIANMLVDICYKFIDPRINLD